jgi:inner membrane protein
MDIVTHALAGFALARAGMSRWGSAAAPIAMLGAVAPDVDVLARFASPEAYLDWRRTVTHSWMVSPLLALAAASLARLFRPVPWGNAWLAAWVGVASHILLDAVTLRGVSWLWPLSKSWYGADWTVTGDPWPGIILSLAAIAPFLSGLVSGEIGARRSPGIGWAIAALLGVGVYLGFRGQLHGEAIAALDSRVYDGRPARRLAALPDAWNPFEWEGLVDDGSSIRRIPVSLSQEFDPGAGQAFFPPRNGAAVESAKRSGLYGRVDPHVSWPRWQVIPFGDGVEVRMEELRLGFGAVFELDAASGAVREERFEPPD